MLKMFDQYRGLPRSAYALFVSRLVTSMGAFIWPMLTMIMSIKLGYSESQIAYIFLIISAVFLPGTILGGKLADKFNKKIIIVIFDLISVSFFFACAFIEPGTLMLIFFTIAGLFATMEGPSHEALAIEASLPKDREKFFSLSYLGFNLGFIAGASLGGFLITNYLGLAFIIDGTTTILSTLLIVLFVIPIKKEDIQPEDRNEYEDEAHHKVSVMKILSKRKSVLIQICIVVMTAFIYDTWTFVLPLHMADIFGSVNGPLFYGFVASFNGFVVIAATPLLTYLLKKKFELPKIITALTIYCFAFVFLITSEQLPIFFIFMLLFTLGEIINTIGLSPFISRRVPSTHRGRINSFQNIAAFMGSIIAKVIMGNVIEKTGFHWAYMIIIFVALTAVIITSINYILDKKIFPKIYQDKNFKSDFIE